MYMWITLIIICFIIYCWATWNYDYWKKKGIPFVEPVVFFGNLKEWILLKKNSGEVYAEFYWKFPNEAAVGIFKLREPQLVLRDMDLIKTVCVKEFKCFQDNDVYVDPSVDTIFGMNPVVAKGEKWKYVRNVHSKSPISKNIKEMFPLIMESSKNLMQTIESNEGKVFKTKPLSQNYINDALAICVFGLKTNLYHHYLHQVISEKGSFFNVAYVAFTLVPQLNQLLRIKFVASKFKKNIIKIIKLVSENHKINDNGISLIQTLLDENSKCESPKYSLEEMAAHASTLYGGLDNTSTLMAFVIYFLAKYPDVQAKIKAEIKLISNIDYEKVRQMKYLDSVINETLRLYTSGQVLRRTCTKDIILKSENRSYPITKGMTVAIPVYAIHRDPKYFTNPLEFDPYRFYNNISSNFMPFGIGPRACTNPKFGIAMVKAALVNILKNFKIICTNHNEELPTLSHHSLFITPKKELEVIFVKDCII